MVYVSSEEAVDVDPVDQTTSLTGKKKRRRKNRPSSTVIKNMETHYCLPLTSRSEYAKVEKRLEEE